MTKKALRQKLVLTIIAGAMVFSVTACGGGDEKATVDTTESVIETEADIEINMEETEASNGEQNIQIAIRGTDAEEATTAESTFKPVQSKDGRWQKGRADQWTFILNSTNEVAKEVAVEIDGTLYYFDADGNMANEGWAKDTSGIQRYVKNGAYVTGWIDGKYYVDAEKGKLTGLCEIEGKQYLLDSEGLVVDGWYEDPDTKNWYYAQKGILITNDTHEVDGKIYGFDSTGAMIRNEGTIKDKRYIFKEDGEAITGLIDTESGKVYCDEGEVQTGKIEVNGVVLLFKDDGTLDVNKFVNGIYINADGTADASKRVTNIGAFANKDGIDDIMNNLPDKLVEEMFVQNGWKLIYDATVKGSMEEIEGAGAVSFTNKYLKFHNLDTVGHRLGHYVQHVTKKAAGIAEIRKEEFANLGWDEYFGKSDNEYFSEAVGHILVGNFDKEKAPKTYEYISSILAERYDFKK